MWSASLWSRVWIWFQRFRLQFYFYSKIPLFPPLFSHCRLIIGRKKKCTSTCNLHLSPFVPPELKMELIKCTALQMSTQHFPRPIRIEMWVNYVVFSGLLAWSRWACNPVFIFSFLIRCVIVPGRRTAAQMKKCQVQQKRRLVVSDAAVLCMQAVHRPATEPLRPTKLKKFILKWLDIEPSVVPPDQPAALQDVIALSLNAGTLGLLLQ